MPWFFRYINPQVYNYWRPEKGGEYAAGISDLFGELGDIVVTQID